MFNHKKHHPIFDIYIISNIGGIIYFFSALVYYTQGDYERQFIVTEDEQEFVFTGFDKGAKNKGISVPLVLKKYDAITKETVETGNAQFEVQEYIEDLEEWLPVCVLSYDEESQVYSTLGVKMMTCHDSKGDISYSQAKGEIVFTSANRGKFRVIERVQPSNYEKGRIVYVREFDITKDIKNGIVDLTDSETGPKNIGISGVVRVSKFDRVTNEKVLDSDAEFMVYEYIHALDKWLEIGILGYDERSQEYVCDGIEFVFHDSDGKTIDIMDTDDFEKGKLYYTTANQGKYKVEEIKAPSNYIIDGFCEEFTISESWEEFEYRTMLQAYDTGIAGRVKLKKEDSIYGTDVSGAIFAVQEWSEDLGIWLDIGELKDNEDGTYDTSGMTYDIHTGREESEVVQADALVYTTQNRGRFRIVEKQAPKGYMNDMYISPELLLCEDNTDFELKDETKATDTPIRVSISKKSATTGKEIIGARLTVKDMNGRVIDTWISDEREHIIAAIEPGKYVLIEERAPRGYKISSEVEFEIKETYELQRVEMFDEETEGKVIIYKTDRENGKGLQGAVFEIRDENGNLIDTLITDSDGYAESKNICFGIYGDNGSYIGSHRYTLCETKAPLGYVADSSQIQFEFECDDEHEKIIEKLFDLKNDREPPVGTGDGADKKIILFMIIAAITIAVLGVNSKMKE